MSDEIDCTSCGACCISNWDTETYVGMYNSDVRRLKLATDEETVHRLVAHRNNHWEQGMRTKENEQGHITCIALDGRVGECVSCSIYDARPKACRNFRPGSEECKLAREEAAITAEELAG